MHQYIPTADRGDFVATVVDISFESLTSMEMISGLIADNP
jgi:hypothetical protein